KILVLIIVVLIKLLGKSRLQEKGVQIFQNNVTIDAYEKAAAANGVLITDESAIRRVAESDGTSSFD
ncbi:MAG: hypothetical protein LUF35_10075, partial [Lachnospiraceae bacterium]|nr:hypothetical protein [Lachnospiraceae bacterium]